MAKDMPIGQCCVCDELLDLSDAGICESCGVHHACLNCHDPDANDEDDDDAR